MENNYLLYIIAGCIGSLVAVIELAARYSEHPKWLLSNYASYVYILINFSISFLICWLVIVSDIKIGDNKINDSYLSAIIIGLISMGILRSSLLNIKISGKDTDIGLNKTVDIMLKWVEILYERNKGVKMMKEITPKLGGISFPVFYKSVIPTCMAALKSSTQEDNDKINSIAKKLEDEASIPEQAKVNQLALKAVDLFGLEMLLTGIAMYKNSTMELTAKQVHADERISKLNNFVNQKLHLGDERESNNGKK